MKRWMHCSSAFIGSIVSGAQQPAPADTILTNGKIITVDDQFSIAQAVAVRGDRIVAVGTNQNITRLAGPNTRRIDLRGRSVVPGMIDNHAHFQEEGAYWTLELRFDGVDYAQAGARDDPRQGQDLGARQVGVQPRWLVARSVHGRQEAVHARRTGQGVPRQPRVPPVHAVGAVSQQQGHRRAQARAAQGAVDHARRQRARDRHHRRRGPQHARSTRPGSSMLRTEERPTCRWTSSSPARRSCSGISPRRASPPRPGSCTWEELYRQFQREGTASMRFFCQKTATGGGRGAGAQEKMIAQLATLRYHDGDEWMDNSNYGERFPGGGGGDVIAPGPEPIAAPEVWDAWGRFALAVAKAGIPVQLHSVTEIAIGEQLTQLEKISKEVDLRPLRWSFMHMEGVTPPQIERMKKLNMFIALNPRPIVSGGLLHRIQGDKGNAMPPMREIQDSGIMWGFGTDAFEVNQFRPFQTLYFAVTGKMVGGTVVNTHTVSREHALIAHTRNNAYLFFRENDLGSIQSGRFADLVVTDKDYLTVPADQIKDIKSVLTMVGGRVVYDAATEPSTSTK